MEVKLVDSMGSDLSVVNAARVSFDKISDWDYTIDPNDVNSLGIKNKTLKEADKRIIKFLARENHWTPFGHASLSFHIKAPIFVARQLGKHQVGLVWNEISRRYVDSSPEFYYPGEWRKRNEDKKQGSHEDEFINGFEYQHPFMRDVNDNLLPPRMIKTSELVYQAVNQATNAYNLMLEAGVCPEQARMVLPQNMYTEWYWTGSLIAFARVCKLRLKKDTQVETRSVASMINNIAEDLFPLSWESLMQ
jgi:thymidylate synthase (FAD)